MRTVPEAPEALTGVSLLRRALPGVDEFIVAWRKDILTPSCGGVQLTGQHIQYRSTDTANGGFGAQRSKDLGATFQTYFNHHNQRIQLVAFVPMLKYHSHWELLEILKSP